MSAFDKFGNQFLDIFNSSIFSLERITSLFNISHSLYYPTPASASINPNQNQFSLIVKVRNVGDVTIKSTFFGDAQAYQWTVNPGPISSIYSYGLFEDGQVINAGESVQFKVFPRDAYNNVVQTFSQDDFSVNIIQPGNVNQPQISKTIDTDNNLILIKVDNLTVFGNNYFEVKLNQDIISCYYCQVQVNQGDIVFSNSVLNHNSDVLSTNTQYNLNKGIYPIFSLVFYDNFNNLINSIPTNYGITISLTGTGTIPPICQETSNNYLINIYVCRDSDSIQKWDSLSSNNIYTLTITNNNSETLLYNIQLVGTIDNLGASNNNLDATKTFFSTLLISGIAGQYSVFMIELRAIDGRRWNMYLDNPQNISISFAQNTITNNYSTEIIPGVKAWSILH